MDSLLFFDVEAEVVNTFTHEEIENFIGVVERFAAHNGDDVKVDAVLVEKTCAPHCLLVSASTLTGLTMGVVDHSRSVDAETDRDVMRFNKFAPRVGNKHSVALEGMEDSQARRGFGPDERESVLIPRDRDGERLSSVPDEGDKIADEIGAEDPGDNRTKCLRRHAVNLATTRKIAIVAVDIAERGRLNDRET